MEFCSDQRTNNSNIRYWWNYIWVLKIDIVGIFQQFILIPYKIKLFLIPSKIRLF